MTRSSLTHDHFIALLEAASSKICHDIISPLGAVNNGLEIFEEMGAEAGPEVIELINFSAQQASAKLKAFRMVYGSGGSDSTLKPLDVHHIIDDMISADGKVRQNWAADHDFGFGMERPNGMAKIMMGMLLLMMEALPKGGEIALEPMASGQAGFAAVGRGADLAFKPEVAALLAQGFDALKADPEPKTIHALICLHLCAAYGFSFEMVHDSTEFIQIHILKP